MKCNATKPHAPLPRAILAWRPDIPKPGFDIRQYTRVMRSIASEITVSPGILTFFFGAIRRNILDFDARVLATLAQLGQTVSRSRLALGIGLLGRARLCDILATDPRGFLWSELKSWQELYFERSVCRQQAINSDGRHIGQDVARFSFIRD